MKHAKRFVLPLVLLALTIAALVAADQIGSVSSDAALPAELASLDVPLASVRRLPELVTAPLNTEILSGAFPSEPAALSALSCAVIMIDGQVVHEVRADAALVPGYAQLLVTGHVAIDMLGADHRYQTSVLADALPDDDGRIGGSLYLVGGGDPVLMTFNYSQGFRPVLNTRSAIEELAERVAETGVLSVDGGVVASEGRYDDQRVLPGWPASYAESGLAGPLSALQLDDGFATRASANGGVAIPAEEPALLAAERFDDLLEAQDITIAGLARLLSDDDNIADLVPVASLQSPPLGDIVFQMLAANDASAAEMILKEIGFEDQRDGSTRAGGAAVQRVLSEQGVEILVAPRDGSGLDPVSTASCRQLAAVADTIPDGHETLASLPAYDLPGVFGGAFADLEIDADLRLVGGAVGDASGFVARTVDDGRRIVIASIINRIGGPTEADLGYQRSLVSAVDGLLVSVDPAAVEVVPPPGP